MLNCVAVGIGGFFGSVARYLISQIPIKNGTVFPINTFIINVAGAFALGYVVAALLRGGNIDPRITLFLKVGVCGGFTTFSTFSLETHELMQTGHMTIAVVYAAASISFCVLAIFMGQAVAK